MTRNQAQFDAAIKQASMKAAEKIIEYINENSPDELVFAEVIEKAWRRYIGGELPEPIAAPTMNATVVEPVKP